MKDLIIIFIFLANNIIVYGQIEKSLIGKTGPEIIGHTTIKYQDIVLDGLKININDFDSLHFNRDEIKSFRIKKVSTRKNNNILLIYTNFLFIVDNKPLKTKNEKLGMLSKIDRKNIIIMRKIEKKESIKRFGEKGKDGAIEINLNPK
jgi:hypothetical protein